MEFFLSGWFIISSYSVDADRHSYLVEDHIKNYHVAFTLPEKLSYGENAWIKLRMNATCSEEQQPSRVPYLFVRHFFCTAEAVEELKCTERNSFVVGGRRYC